MEGDKFCPLAGGKCRKEKCVFWRRKRCVLVEMVDLLLLKIEWER